MIPSLIILAILVIAGTILYFHDRLNRKKWEERHSDREPSERQPILSGHSDDSDICCGMHLTCEKDSLSSGISTEIEYYDDEELDVYTGRAPESYTPQETEQFRDILLTLVPHDIAGWARSLQLRSIALPPEVKEELLMIVSEARKSKTEN